MITPNLIASIDAKHTGNLEQIPEADVLFATLDLADEGSVKPAYVSKFRLRSLLGRLKHLTSLLKSTNSLFTYQESASPGTPAL
jgi:hypothetical protein